MKNSGVRVNFHSAIISPLYQRRWINKWNSVIMWRCPHLSRQTFQQRYSRIYNHPTHKYTRNYNDFSATIFWYVTPFNLLPTFQRYLQPSSSVSVYQNSWCYVQWNLISMIIIVISSNILQEVAVPWLMVSAMSSQRGGSISVPGLSMWDFGGQNGAGTGFSLNYSRFPPSIFICLSQMPYSLGN